MKKQNPLDESIANGQRALEEALRRRYQAAENNKKEVTEDESYSNRRSPSRRHKDG